MDRIERVRRVSIDISFLVEFIQLQTNSYWIESLHYKIT